MAPGLRKISYLVPLLGLILLLTAVYGSHTIQNPQQEPAIFLGQCGRDGQYTGPSYYSYNITFNHTGDPLLQINYTLINQSEIKIENVIFNVTNMTCGRIDNYTVACINVTPSGLAAFYNATIGLNISVNRTHYCNTTIENYYWNISTLDNSSEVNSSLLIATLDAYVPYFTTNINITANGVYFNGTYYFVSGPYNASIGVNDTIAGIQFCQFKINSSQDWGSSNYDLSLIHI